MVAWGTLKGETGDAGPTGSVGPVAVIVSETEPTTVTHPNLEVGMLWYKASTGVVSVCTSVA